MPDINRIPVVIQSFAIFTALSVVCGRVYVISYNKTFGVPVPDIQLDVLSYSIVSPDVAIISVGIGLFWAYQYFRDSSRTEVWGFNNVVVGVLLLVAGIALSVFAPESSSIFRNENLAPSMQGLYGLFRLAMLWYGFSLVYDGIPRRSRRRWLLGETETTGPEVQEDLRRLAPGLIGFTMIFVFLLVTGLVSQMGGYDAERKIQEAPLAHVKFHSLPAGLPSHSYSYNLCAGEEPTCVFKVVSIDDKFTYLLRPDVQHENEDVPRLQILSNVNIISINYDVDSEGTLETGL